MSADAHSNDFAAEHIQELSKIKEDVPKLLAAASHAINTLTNRPLPSDDDASDPASTTAASDPLAARKEAFQVHARTYFTLAHKISNNISREIAALEEAGVIPAKTEKVEQTRQEAGGGAAEVKNGGLGDLEVGWLNARTRDVGVGKAGELVAEARRRLEERRKDAARDGGDVDME